MREKTGHIGLYLVLVHNLFFLNNSKTANINLKKSVTILIMVSRR